MQCFCMPIAFILKQTMTWLSADTDKLTLGQCFLNASFVLEHSSIYLSVTTTMFSNLRHALLTPVGCSNW